MVDLSKLHDNGDSWSDIFSTPTIVPPVNSNPYKHDFQSYQNLTESVWESNKTGFWLGGYVELSTYECPLIKGASAPISV